MIEVLKVLIAVTAGNFAMLIYSLIGEAVAPTADPTFIVASCVFVFASIGLTSYFLVLRKWEL